MKEDFMLTTFDNRFNPFTEFEAWFKEDHRLGHNCCELLAIVSSVSSVSSDEIQEADTISAINDIVNRDPTIYRKVKKTDFK